MYIFVISMQVLILFKLAVLVRKYMRV